LLIWKEKCGYVGKKQKEYYKCNRVILINRKNEFFDLFEIKKRQKKFRRFILFYFIFFEIENEGLNQMSMVNMNQ
jgi:hypothetical protein